MLSELARQLSWTAEPAHLYHCRDGHEVDAVLDHAAGDVVAIEVTAAQTVRSEDFREICALLRNPSI
ncbi:MAG: DUF4143 domain-containing protein [Actinobacteria bacterium]|nr:DUF4143 domain-containing protein [Actinomycetota bacterium]